MMNLRYWQRRMGCDYSGLRTEFMRKMILLIVMVMLFMGTMAQAEPIDTAIYELRIVLSTDTDDAELLEFTRERIKSRLAELEIEVMATVEGQQIVIVLLGKQNELLELVPNIVTLSTEIGLLEFVDFSGLESELPQE